MAKDAQKIIEEWRNFVPPLSAKEDVQAVVEEKFPTLYRSASDGSHFIIITDPFLAIAQKHGRDTGTAGGTLSIALKSGKSVKAVYVKNLLKAIAIKEELARELDQGE